MKYAIVTLGCKVNQFETQAMETMLRARGHAPAGAHDADAVIVNTCAVTAESGRKSRQAVRRLMAEHPDAIAAVCGLLVLLAAWKLAPAYVQERLHVDIWADQYGSGYQQCQALIGIARGGWLGLGPGQGELHNVFAYESDIVFSTICEEWGLLYAGIAVLIVLIMLTTVLMNPPKSYYHATMTAGIVAAFVAQMSLNIFGSCNLIPFTGVTLPFISQGGSSLVTCGFMVGMLKAGQSPLFRHQAAKLREDAAAELPSLPFLHKKDGRRKQGNTPQNRRPKA